MIAAALVALVLAGSAVAGPAAVMGSGLAGRLNARRGAVSRPARPISHDGAANENFTNTWAGAALTGPNGTYSSVSGSFIIPTPSVPTGGDSNTNYSAAIWVGIDGWTYDWAILQAAVAVYVENGTVSYSALFEWYPDIAYSFNNISFSAGDNVTVAVVAHSTTSGTATVTNESTGQSVRQDLNSTFPLAQQNAEWIVEDFDTLANFGIVTFTNNFPDPSGADIIDMQQNYVQVTQTFINGSDVTVQYIGN